MRFFAITVAIVVSAIIGSSAPIEKREVGGILLCTGANATGTCIHGVYPMKACHQLPAPFFENINTFAPDGEDFACYPRVTACDEICMSPTGCTFGAVDFNYEHKFNLSAINWNNLFRSFDCALTLPVVEPIPDASGS